MRRCIAIDPEHFATEHWSRQPLLSAAAELPASFADLFSLTAVDELLSERGLRTPFLRMAQDGKVIDAARFTRSGGAGAGIGDQVADDKVLALFADGATIVFQGLHRTWRPVIDFGAALGTDLGHPVQVNAYITPAQSRGFAAHYDVHDVFVLQVAGTKRWLIHPPVQPDPLPRQVWTDHRVAVEAAAKTEPTIDAVLRPGDCLYLPRGWLHAAEALGETSVHLTVGVHPVTRYAVVQALTELAAQDASLRSSLPLGIDPADHTTVATSVDETIDALIGWLGGVDRTAVGDRLRQQLWDAVRPAPIAPLAQAAAVTGLSTAGIVRLRPHLRCRLDKRGEQLSLVLSDRTVTLPPETGSALEAVLAGRPIAVGDLPGLEPDDQLVLARRLLREAVVIPCPG